MEQIIHVTMRFVWEEEGKEMSDRWEFPLRYFFSYEPEHLIHRSNLDLISIYGDFLEREPNADSQDFVVVCSKS